MVRILLVEDNPVFLKSFRQGISNRFRSVVIEEAISSEEALEKTSVNPPDLIFMDLRLPGINGLEATKKIKTGYPKIRVAMVTDYDLPEYSQVATQFGADGFFVKESIRWDEVETLIKSISPQP